MKFLMTYASDPGAPPPTPEQLAAIGKFTEEMMKSGKVVLTGGITRPTTGTKVALTGGKLVVTDGPFPETKELIDGFVILEVGSLEEAIENAERFMKVAGEGRGEIMRIFEYGAAPH